MDFPYGALETNIPPEFVPPEVWPEYGYIAAPPPFCRREHVDGQYNSIRWSLWPFTFEQYIGDEEPDLLLRSSLGRLALNRSVTWIRIRRTDAPEGWRAETKVEKVDGFKLLGDDPTEGWHKNARRDLRLWLERHENITHRIEPITLEEFDRAYRDSLIARRVDTDRLTELKRRWTFANVESHIELWGVRAIADGKIIAGTALIHSPTHKGSTHMAPFIHEEGRTVFAATALIHHWFSRAKERGDAFVVTTNFWFPGKPKEWKGFSEFKSHFGWRYIAYPPLLKRYVRGRLF